MVTGQTSQWVLSWDKNSEADMDHYIVFRDTSANPTSQIAIVGRSDTTYADNQISKGILYFYRLKAVDNTNNESDFSEQVSAAIPKIDFSKLNTQMIGPGQSKTIPNINDYVTDPDNMNNITWSAASQNLSVQFSGQNAIITAPGNFNQTEDVQFTATGHGGFFDVANVTFNLDTSFIVPANGQSIFAYPVPLNLNDSPNGKISFENVPDNATILIYNLLGELVYKIKQTPYVWNVKNDSGKAINPGVYLYYIKSSGKKRTGKLVILK